MLKVVTVGVGGARVFIEADGVTDGGLGVGGGEGNLRK